jgi:hypothetical protein
MGCWILIDYSARIFRKRRLRQFEGQLPDKPQELKYRERLRRILKVILTYGETGISHKILAESIKLDRKSLRKYTKKLVEIRLIRREGKNGKYFPTNVSKSWIYISADILGKRFRDMAFPSIKKEEEYFSIPIGQREFRYEEPEPLKEVTSEYIIPRHPTEKTDEIDLERILFDFSNTIGGFVTFVLIQALNLSPGITERSEDFEEKGLLAQKWIADILSIMSEDLIYVFEAYT